METHFNWGWKNKVFFEQDVDVPEIAGPSTRLWPNGSGGVGSAPDLSRRYPEE